MTQKPTIKATWNELQKHNIAQQDLCLVQDLNKYGFDTELVNGLIKYEIFPQTYLVVGAVYVRKQDIQTVINTLLKNSVKIYETVEACEQREQEFVDELESKKIKLSREDLQAIESGKTTLEEIHAQRMLVVPVVEDFSILDIEDTDCEQGDS